MIGVDPQVSSLVYDSIDGNLYWIDTARRQGEKLIVFFYISDPFFDELSKKVTYLIFSYS